MERLLYYYMGLLLVSLFMLVCFSVIVYMIYNLIKGNLKKRWWLYIVLLSPFLGVMLYHFGILPYMDLPYAIRHDVISGEGTVDRVYFQGDNHVNIGGFEYRYNPWHFDPVEEVTYSFEYLPHSKYIVEIIKVAE